EFGGERIVEALIVGRPPERVVDDVSAFERRALQKGAIEGHFMRDAINDDVVMAGFIQPDAAEFDELGDHRALAALIYPVNQSQWKRLLAPDQNAYSVHSL